MFQLRSILMMIVVAVVVWWVRRRLEQLQARLRERTRAAQQQKLSERMLACAHCGVLTPQSEGVVSNGLVYCCKQHRDAALRG